MYSIARVASWAHTVAVFVPVPARNGNARMTVRVAIPFPPCEVEEVSVEPIRNALQSVESNDVLRPGSAKAPLTAMAGTPPSRLSLPPKGACWYCDKPLDSVKRFCGRGCSAAFDEEAAFSPT